MSTSSHPARTGDHETVLLLLSHGLIEPTQIGALEQQQDAPWWLNALLALSAWVASILILAAFAIPVALLFGSETTLMLVGSLVMLVISLLLFHHTQHLFASQFALVLSLAAQVLLTVFFAEKFHFFSDTTTTAFLCAAVALALVCPRSTPLHRTLCALIALVGIVIAINHFSWGGLKPFALALSAIACVLWLRREYWAGSRFAPWLRAFTHASTLLAFALIIGINIIANHSLFFYYYSNNFQLFYFYSPGAMLVFLGVCFWMTRTLSLKQRIPFLAAALIYSLPGCYAPGLMLCSALVLVTFYACQRPWFYLSLFFSLLQIGEFYYNMQISLLMKSGALIASGIVLLIIRQVLLSAQRRPA